MTAKQLQFFHCEGIVHLRHLDGLLLMISSSTFTYSLLLNH
jgi:hypothetical protein